MPTIRNKFALNKILCGYSKFFFPFNQICFTLVSSNLFVRLGNSEYGFYMLVTALNIL